MSVHRVETQTGKVKYEVRWKEGLKPNGQPKQRSKRFPLKRDAAAFDLEVERRRQLGPLAMQQLTVKGPTLGSWIAERWATEHASGLEVKTRDRYANSYEVHIEPWLGHLTLQELTVGRLREWQAERRAAGVSAHALMKARTVMSSILRHAAESEAIAGNPMALVRPPKAPHAQDVIALSPRQIEQIRTLLRPRDATIVSLLAYSGIRPGELRALRWGDVGENTIRVQNGANPDGSVKATKTRRGRRNVRLLPALAIDLGAWRTHTGGRGRQRVFASSGADGGMTEEAWSDWRANVWVPARDQVLEHKPRPYDLRHSFASLLLAEGRSVHYVAEQLGHDAALTLSTYGHLIAEYSDRRDLDIDDEIEAARIAAAGWRPPTPQREPQLGSIQRTVLRQAHAAGSNGVVLPVWNQRRRAMDLTERGLLEHVDGQGEQRRFVITARGIEAAQALDTHEQFGLSSAATTKGAKHA